MMPPRRDRAGPAELKVEQAPRAAAASLGVDYESDQWDLSSRETIAETPSGHRISFAAFPAGVKNEVKNFVLDDLVAGNRSNSWVRYSLVTLRQFARIVVERHGDGVTLADLSHGDAVAVEAFFRDHSSPRARPRIALVAGFAAFARRQHGQVGPQFRPDPASVPPQQKSGRSYSEGLERVIPMEVRDALMAAVGHHEERLAR